MVVQEDEELLPGHQEGHARPCTTIGLAEVLESGVERS